MQSQAIVVVEDDEEMGQAIRRLLKAAGYGVTTFQSAEALLRDEAALKADCFVLDVHLPGLTGFELRQKIAMRRAVAPVIFITADEDREIFQRAWSAGAVAVFLKPFNGPAFLATVADALVPLPQSGGEPNSMTWIPPEEFDD